QRTAALESNATCGVILSTRFSLHAYFQDMPENDKFISNFLAKSRFQFFKLYYYFQTSRSVHERFCSVGGLVELW
ncbi:hypothetical protein, partial [Candidatus Symbiopectobacterium sp. NZEC135]|uniref:hypothetical protein n=1 Tax=Candidatus Symbiopectobacterium sp. NZEC135 TaxID=2820471 RepID=UPI00222747B6